MSRFSVKKPFHQDVVIRHISEMRNLLHALELRDFQDEHENRPLVDIYETCSQIVLEFDLAGFQSENITLTVCGLSLVLEANRPREQASPQDRYLCLERRHGRFHHAVHIPCSFDQNSISAEYRRGVLRVTCPKINDRKVPIKEIVD